MVDFSLFSVLECPEGRFTADVYREMLALCAYGEELGFSGAWVAEHHFSGYGTLGGPAVFLSALAARTHRLRLGAIVSVLPLHDPIRVAEDYAAVDVISGGRLDFAAGRGYQAKSAQVFGLEIGHARARFVEALGIVERAWRDGYVDFRGKYFRYQGIEFQPETVQEQIPIYLASVSPQTCEIVRNSGYSIMGSLMPEARQPLARLLASYCSTLPAAHRGRIRIPIMTPVYVAESNDAAFRDVMPEISWYWDTAGHRMPAVEDNLDDSYAYFRKLAERASGGRDGVARTMARWPIGDVDRVSQYLIDLVRQSGCDEIVCYAAIGGMEFRKAAGNIERLAGEVIPRVQAALADDKVRVAMA